MWFHILITRRIYVTTVWTEGALAEYVDDPEIRIGSGLGQLASGPARVMYWGVNGPSA